MAKKNYILVDTDGLKLLGDKYFFKKVLEYFNYTAKVKFITHQSEIESFFREMEKHFDYAGRIYARECFESSRPLRAYYELC